MPFAGEWCKVWIYFGFVFAWAKGARPRFDTSTDMGLVLVPADAEVDSVIFRLRATDQDADFPLVFEITATITPVVRIDNLPCTLYNKVCQANVILTKRLVPGRLHDFAVRVRDTKGDSNSMQATISVTNATTPRDKIFPHIPSLIMVPEDTKPGKEIDYLLVRANSWSGKPVYIELWQPKELFTIRQRQTPTQTRGVIILTGELDFETQSMYTLTMYATDPYTEPGKDTRNIAGLSVVVIVQDVQDVPPIFTLAPPLTRINNSVQPGDIILRVHAEDGDKGVPREIVYGLVSEGNPFTPFFNISETSGEITLAKPLDELTQITHVGAPVVLTVVAEEIRRSREEPPAQATVVDVGFLLGEPGNSPPYFESDKLVPETYIATIDENPDPGTVITFGEPYSTRVKDEDIGKAGVFALKLENNNNTFEVNPTVAERTADFIITVRDNTLIDYELYKVLSFKIVAQEVGPATNLSASVPVSIFLRDINDNPPIFDEESYEVTLSENVTAESRVVQVHASDKDTGVYGSIRYTGITGEGSEAFIIDPDTGLITVAMGSSLDREVAAKLVLTVEARDEDGNGNKGVAPLIINLLDVNDNAPIFERDVYEFMLNSDLTNFTSSAFIKAIDSDAEPPNNVVRYELIHGNYENKFYLNETSGEIILLSPITKIRRKKQSAYEKFSKKAGSRFVNSQGGIQDSSLTVNNSVSKNESLANDRKRINLENLTKEMMMEVIKKRRKRDNDNALYTLTARAYDLGVPHLSSETKIRIISGIVMEARIMMFVVPGEQPDSTKTAETLAAITGGRVTVLETRPYIQQNHTGGTGVLPTGGKKSIIVARVEQTEPGTSLVDVEKIRETLAANGVGIIGGTDTIMNTTHIDNTKPPTDGTPRHTNPNDGQTTIINNTITTIQNEEVTVYKAENKLLFWLLIILGLLMLLAIAALIVCCICPGCPFYMAPRKRRVHSSETLVVRADGRPKRHLHRQPAVAAEVSWNGRKQAWSADPTRRNWQFNKRNVKNCSLPGDVAYISGQPNDLQMNIEAQRLRDGPAYGHSRRSRMNEQERMYMEDVEEQKVRGYRTAELDSLQRHEMDRGSDLQHQAYRQRFMEPDMNEETTIREQHFFREGNAEVLRLVTRGQVEDTSHPHQLHHHRPTTLIVDGKDIILQRFIEDQKSRHELSMQDIEAARSMESHQRPKELCQQQQQPEIILIPDRLDLGHRQHIEEIGPTVQRLVIDHGDYNSPEIEKESLRQEKQDSLGAPIPDRPSVIVKDQVQPSNAQYGFHDLELARQNALLTRLLLEKENRRAGAGAVDSTSYLETQSLPGQVAIATQTDRTAATQTERQVKSRSDNDESDEESRHRKKLKSRKKYGDGDWKRSRTLWMKSPIEEEGSPCFDKRLSILRKKVREVKEGRKVSLEPEVLREISDSLDGNGSSYKGEEDDTMRSYRKSTEQTSISYKILNEKETGSQSSEETRKEDHKTNVTESTSSAEMKLQREKHGHGKADEKSPKKEKPKAQQKSEGVIKPSFRILEKEFTMLTKKLSKLGDKKFRESTGSDSTSQEKSDSLAKETKKDSDQRSLKKVDTTSQKQTSESGQTVSKVDQKGKQRKESAIAKTKQKLKYQQTQVMSTGSSEFDDALDKPKKLNLPRHDSLKQKSLGTHVKLKRLGQMDRRESKKQTAECRDEEAEKRKEGAIRETQKAETKSEKIGKVTKATKMAVLPRKQNVSEETSTSTEERKEERAVCALRAFEKKSSTDFSSKESDGMQQHEGDRFVKRVIQKFSDDFVEEPKKEDALQKAVISLEKERDMSRRKEREIEGPKVTGQELDRVDTVPRSNNGLGKGQGSLEKPGKSDEHVTAKKAMEDSKTPLHVTEQLITDFTVIHKSPAKKEVTSKTTVQGQETKEPMKYKEESVRNGNEIETARADRWKGLAQHVQDKLGSYMEKIKSVGDSEKQIEAKTEAESKEQSEEDKETADRGEELKEAKKVEESPEYFTKKKNVLEESKEMEKEDRMEEIFRGRKEMDVPTDYFSMKEDIEEESHSSQETRGQLEVEVEVHTPMRGHDDTINGIKVIEEPVMKSITKAIPGNHKNGKNGKNGKEEASKGEANGDKKKDKMAETIREGEKEVEHVDTLIPVPVVEDKEKDSTEIETNGREKKKIDLDTMKIPFKEEVSKVETDEPKTEGNIFLGEKKVDKGEVEQMKPRDQVEKDILVDKETKISDEEKDTTMSSIKDYEIGEKTMEEWEIAKEKIEDEELDKEKTMDDKIIGGTIVEHKTDEGKIEDQEIGKEVMEDDKIPEETTTEHKIPEEATEDQEIDKEVMEDDKILKDITIEHKIPEKATEDQEIDKEVMEDDKISKDTTIEHKIPEETTEDQEIDKGVMKDDRIPEETIIEHKIPEEAIEDREIYKGKIEDHKIIGESVMEDKIAEEPIKEKKIDTEMKEDHKIIGEDTMEGKMIDKQTEDQKIRDDEIKDHKIAEKSSMDQKIAEIIENIVVDEEATKDHKIIEEKSEDQKSDKETVDDKIDEKSSVGYNIIEEAIKDEKIDKETIQDHKTDEEPIIDQTVPEEVIDKKKVDKETTEEHETVTKSTIQYGDTEEIIKDKKIDEETIEDFKIVAEETTDPKIKISQDTIAIEADDYQKTLTKPDNVIDLIAKEKMSDEEKETLTKIEDDKEKDIFLEEGKIFEEETIVREIKPDDHEISKEKVPLDKEGKIADVIIEDQNRETQSITDRKKTLAKEEETREPASTDDYKIKEKEHISSDNEKETQSEKREEAVKERDKIEDSSLKEQEDIGEDKEKEKYPDEQTGIQKTDDSQIKELAKEPIKDYEITDKIITESGKIDHQDSKEEAEEMQPIDNSKIMEEEITEIQEVTGEKFVPETSSSEQERTIETKDDISQIQELPEDKDGFTEVSDVPKDEKVIEEKEDSLKISPTKQDIEKPEVSTEIPISTKEDLKKDTPMEPPKSDNHASKKESIFSEMFKAVHSFVDKLTNNKETPITEQSHPISKIIDKEMPSLSSDEKDKKQTEILGIGTPSISQTRSESSDSKSSESQKIEEDMSKDKTFDQASIKATTTPKEATEKTLKTDTSESQKLEEDMSKDKTLDQASIKAATTPKEGTEKTLKTDTSESQKLEEDMSKDKTLDQASIKATTTPKEATEKTLKTDTSESQKLEEDMSTDKTLDQASIKAATAPKEATEKTLKTDTSASQKLEEDMSKDKTFDQAIIKATTTPKEATEKTLKTDTSESQKLEEDMPTDKTLDQASIKATTIPKEATEKTLETDTSESQKLEEDMSKDKTLDQASIKAAAAPKEATKKTLETDTSQQPKQTEPHKDDQELDKPSKDEITEGSESLMETSSTVESSEPVHELESPTKARDEKKEEIKYGADVSGELFEGTAEASMEPEKVADNETVDGELARTIEKEEQLQEPSSKASASFQKTELPGSSPQTYEPTEKEKFAFDSIISGTPTNSTKISEFAKQLESESEQTVLPEVEQLTGEETSSAMGDEIRTEPTFPLDQSNVGPEASTNVARGESEKQDATKKTDRPSVEVVAREEMRQEPVGEGYVDVSLPLFTSMIDTADDSEDSDSSSDISRKTTLTTRPYQTPRHRARQLSEKETSQAKETTEVLDIEDEERATLTIELIEDDNVESSKEDKISDVEQSSSTELAKTEEEKKARSSQEITNIPVPISHTMENRQGAKKGERKQSSEESSTIAKHTEDRKLDPRKKDQGKTANGQNAPSVSKLAKTETFKVADKRTKELERKRMTIQRKKKSSSEESSEEKAIHMAHRTRKKLLDEQPKQKDSDQAKQSRRREEESRRKQSISKSRAEKDKKSSSSGEKYPTPPKTGEIDTSKTQPKYMAWYKKNREEMERKRAELMATDDEEQLPKWLRRSMRSQKMEKEEKKQSSETAAELTPRTRRKVKPLVNVESEQLKAIVRQGRKLRRAEGGKDEDPPIQIFATTPPSVPQTGSKHHLMQHSEYKYEKIPAPFYLHPPPAPHPSPQLSPEHFDMPPTIERERTDEDFDSGIPMSVQSGNRLRHQQLLEKKSVFDIAYSEAAPSQLRSDSTTPPS